MAHQHGYWRVCRVSGIRNWGISICDYSKYPLITIVIYYIPKDVKETPVPGVRKLSENTFVVKLSTLKQHDIWSPEYYNNVNQADIIAEAFKNVKTTSDFIAKAKDIIESRCVKVHNSGFAVTYRLNDTTISTIQKYCGDAEVD